MSVLICAVSVLRSGDMPPDAIFGGRNRSRSNYLRLAGTVRVDSEYVRREARRVNRNSMLGHDK